MAGDASWEAANALTHIGMILQLLDFQQMRAFYAIKWEMNQQAKH